MPPGLPASPLSRFLVLGAAFVILVAGMQAAAPILVPFLLSLFITVIAAPPLFYLLRKGLPPWLAVLGIGFLVFLIGTLLALLIGGSLDQFSANLPRYQEQLAARDARITQHRRQQRKLPMTADPVLWTTYHQ